jgi:putative ATPase
MKELGYGKGYKYPHHHPDAFVEEEYLPDPRRGREKEIRERMDRWWKDKKKPPQDDG